MDRFDFFEYGVDLAASNPTVDCVDFLNASTGEGVEDEG